MHIFYTPNIESNIFFLDKEESKHCIKVLRLKKGDKIQLINGNGTFCEAQIVTEEPKNCQVKITKTIENFGKKKYSLHIAISPTKNNSRFEWFLEKATEIGIDEITPLITFHSERKIIKPERLNKVIISAMKQSVKAYIPKLNNAEIFNNFIRKDFLGKKYIAYCEGTNFATNNTNNIKNIHLKDLYTKGENVLILIGPEGGFSEKEVDDAEQNNFKRISLGESRLRTETAGIVACHTISLMND